MAILARMLATKVLPQDALIPFTSCRLIALNKQRGVRRIRGCEVLRRILAKAALQVISLDIVEAYGFFQKCPGMTDGIEAAVHALRGLYKEPTAEGILFIDTKNAFNCLNLQVALRNVRYLFPSLVTVLQNF